MKSESWTDLPLSEVLYRWTARNTGLPPEIVSTTFYVAILAAMWFTLLYMVRLVRFTIMRLVWPMVLFAIALFIFACILNLFGREQIKELMQRL